MSDAGWLAYYQPFQKRVEALKASMPNSKALVDCDNEVKQFFDSSTSKNGLVRQPSKGSEQRDFDYQFFVLKKLK